MAERTGREIVVWVLQLVAGAILLWAGSTKFAATAGNVFVFSELGMEPTGRIIIGLIEVSAAAMLLTSSYAAVGALFGFGTMCGAVIAHVSILGFDVEGDGGIHVALLVAVLVSTATVVISRRATLPLIGSTLE